MRSKYLVLAVGLLLLLAVPGATAVPTPVAVSVDSTVVADATGFAYQNNLVVMDNGTMVAGYIDVDSNLAIRYSEDDGVTWSDPIHPDNITVRDESEICMVYDHSTEDINFVYTSTNVTGATRVRQDILDTETWLCVGFINITGGSYNESQPYITWAPDNETMIVVWIMYVGGAWTLFISFSYDGGMTWSEECDIINPYGHNQSWPCLAMDSNDTLHLTYSWENVSGEWDYYYSRCEFPWAVFSPPQQVCEVTGMDQERGKVIIIGPITVPDLGTGCIKGFFWNEDNATLDHVCFTLGFAEGNDTSNSSMLLSDDGDYVTAAGNTSGFRAVWTDWDDEHLHQTYLAVDWAQVWDLDPEEWEDWEEALEDIEGVIDYAIDEEITVDIQYDIYFDHNASLSWQYGGGTNVIDKMVFTHSASTHVVYYDFDDEFIGLSDYEWITDLTNTIISLMGTVLVLAVVISVFKGLGKSIKKM